MKHAPLAPVVTLVALAALGACATAPEQTIDESKLIDLTWAFGEETLYWPTGRAFELERVSFGADDEGRWYASNDYSGSEHGGTHMDAPVHFARGMSAAADVPLERLVGPAHVIDVRAACRRDSDYLLTAEDVEQHESAHGPIPRGAVVLVRTGWGRYWPNAEAYLGSSERGQGVELHFPGISAAAAELFVTRGVDLVGIDTASLDHGPSEHFPAHRVLGEADVPGLENLAHLERLPATGATVIALPMKIAGGTGGPARVVALLP